MDEQEKLDIQAMLDKLKLSIDDVSVDIYIDNGEEKEPTHVCYWHIEEVEEDATVAMSMINAVHLFHTNPKELLERLYLLIKKRWNSIPL